jgi:hypothetical protein
MFNNIFCSFSFWHIFVLIHILGKRIIFDPGVEFSYLAQGHPIVEQYWPFPVLVYLGCVPFNKVICETVQFGMSELAIAHLSFFLLAL